LKTAIVTGASGGIGGAIAEKLIDDGFFVFAQYNGGKNRIDSLVQKLKLSGKDQMICPIRFELTSTESIKSAFIDVQKSYSHVDVLVNCAGVGLYKLINETTEEEWDKLFSINVKGAQTLTALTLDKMIENKSGKIVNVSSIWGAVGASMEVAYSASKAALIGYTKALAKEVGPSGINVNCVCPGVIDTNMNKIFTEQDIKELEYSTPLGRIGKPFEVAELVSFLCSEKSDFITGQIITVDGGFTL